MGDITGETGLTRWPFDHKLTMVLLEVIGMGQRTGKEQEPLGEEDEVWHKLVMDGLGGCMVAEAKTCLSCLEFGRWVAFYNKLGSLNPALRKTCCATMLASVLANVHSKEGGD
ncbi:hypothetical protein ACSEE7_20145 [Halomonas cupida]|uniref:hypothetical protein n=1 Tax=Halomonas cupida TaxID=44933 RepID=UPI003EF21F9A